MDREARPQTHQSMLWYGVGMLSLSENLVASQGRRSNNGFSFNHRFIKHIEHCVEFGALLVPQLTHDFGIVGIAACGAIGC